MSYLHDQRVLALNADCTACCPNDGHGDLLAAGTYQLDASTGERKGMLYTYSVQSGEHGRYALHDLDTIDLPGIVFNAEWRRERMLGTLNLFLDVTRAGIFQICWDPNPNNAIPCLALALTDGTLALIQVRKNGNLEVRWKVDVDHTALTTCVDFQSSALTSDRVLSVSSSKGDLAIVKVRALCS